MDCVQTTLLLPRKELGYSVTFDSVDQRQHRDTSSVCKKLPGNLAFSELNMSKKGSAKGEEPSLITPELLQELTNQLIPALVPEVAKAVTQVIAPILQTSSTSTSEGVQDQKNSNSEDTDIRHSAEDTDSSEEYIRDFGEVPHDLLNPHPRPPHAPAQPGLYDISADPIFQDIKTKLGANTAATHEAKILIPLVSYFHDYLLAADAHCAQLVQRLSPEDPLVIQQAVLNNGLRSIFGIAATRHTYITARADYKGTDLEGLADTLDLKIEQKTRSRRSEASEKVCQP